MRDDATRWALAVHEAGHALLAVLAGDQCVEAHLIDPHGAPTRKADAALSGGRTLSSCPTPASDAHAAFRFAVVTAAGEAAERLALGQVATGGDEHLHSDLSLLASLAKTFGGGKCVRWMEKAEARAAAVLARYYHTLLRTAERLYDGDRVGDGFPPLCDLRPRPEMIDGAKLG